jgi:hypothetical protein
MDPVSLWGSTSALLMVVDKMMWGLKDEKLGTSAQKLLHA